MKQILFLVPNCQTCEHVKSWLEKTDTLQYVECQWVYTRDGRLSQKAAAFDVYDGPILVVLKEGEVIAKYMGAREITPGIVKNYCTA